MSEVRLHLGDCREVLATMPEACVSAVVTDPPYGLVEPRSGMVGMKARTSEQKAARRGGFMGKAWDAEVPGVEVWRAVLRVLQPGGYMLAMGGSRTYHRLAVAVEDAGFEIRDCLMWLYGTGFPKGKGCLKPAWEPILLARKPGPRVLPLGVDECRIPANGERLSGGMVSSKADGWNRPWKHDAESVRRCKERLASNAQKAESLGRWPANVCHDGSDEVVGAFAGIPGMITGKSPGKSLGIDASPARFFYCSKPSQAERAGSTHPTMKPVSLMVWLVKLVCPPGGVVLDPFAGSGTTGVACIQTGRDFIGVEMSEEYHGPATRRLAAAQAMPKPDDCPLFTEAG